MQPDDFILADVERRRACGKFSVYSELLFKQAYEQTVQWWHYWPVVLLVLLAGASPVLGFQLLAGIRRNTSAPM